MCRIWFLHLFSCIFTLYHFLNCFLEFASFLIIFCFFCLFWVLFLWVKNQGKLLLLKHHKRLIAGLFWCPLGVCSCFYGRDQESFERSLQFQGRNERKTGLPALARTCETLCSQLRAPNCCLVTYTFLHACLNLIKATRIWGCWETNLVTLAAWESSLFRRWRHEWSNRALGGSKRMVEVALSLSGANSFC